MKKKLIALFVSAVAQASKQASKHTNLIANVGVAK